jgi:2-succinyl-5-enolpyruvyl-6-hydroxy-3-cyclohexene-1-carboxylate synthase
LLAPILAEPGSGVPSHNLRINHFDQFLRDESLLKKMRPDLILRFGDQPYTKSLLTALNKWRDASLVQFVGRAGWQDHEMSTDHTVELKAGDTLDIASFKPKQSTPYLESWLASDSDAASILTHSLEARQKLCDGHIFHHLANVLSDNWNAIYSNSLPVRDAALFGYPSSRLFLNRGVAGIDGIISTAYGTMRGSGRPTCCVIGDLAFLHDSNALMALRELDKPFVIVVVNNGGGNIFRMLPIHQHNDVYTNYFETPQNVQIEHLAKAHGIRFSRVESVGQLTESLDGVEADSTGAHIIECVTDAEQSMALRRELWEA